LVEEKALIGEGLMRLQRGQCGENGFLKIDDDLVAGIAHISSRPVCPLILPRTTARFRSMYPKRIAVFGGR
jgi:hypothetical protein